MPAAGQQQAIGALSQAERRLRTALVGLAFALFSLILMGLFYLATAPSTTLTATLAYTSGLSMIVLPCTLPLVFLIVPLSMGKGYQHGLSMALLFGLGLAITLSVYGVAVAWLGDVLALEEEIRLIYVIAGLAAFVFGLVELDLLPLRLPAFNAVLPGFLQARGEYVGAFAMGLLLGNAGIGCPNPAFYVLLTYLAGTGDISYGGLMGLVHGVGRATPLLFLAVLAMLGVNAIPGLLQWRVRVERAVGWSLIVLGAFILVMGGLYHEWYEESILHVTWNNVLQRFLGGKLAETMELMAPRAEHVHSQWPAPWLFGAMVLLPVVWYGLKRRRPLRQDSTHGV